GRDVGDGPLDVVQRDLADVRDDPGAGAGAARPEAGAGAQLRAGGHRAPPAASSFSTYLAMTSTSRLTSSPGRREPGVLRFSVSGIRLTSNHGGPSEAASPGPS